MSLLTIELAGLELFGYHGVEEDERRHGQPFLVDLWLDVRDDASRSDLLRDTVDYREIALAVREVSDANKFRLLEAFAGAVAETLLARFPVQRARVRVRKPAVRLYPPVEHSAVVVERP